LLPFIIHIFTKSGLNLAMNSKETLIYQAYWIKSSMVKLQTFCWHT